MSFMNSSNASPSHADSFERQKHELREQIDALSAKIHKFRKIFFEENRTVEDLDNLRATVKSGIAQLSSFEEQIRTSIAHKSSEVDIKPNIRLSGSLSINDSGIGHSSFTSTTPNSDNTESSSAFSALKSSSSSSTSHGMHAGYSINALLTTPLTHLIRPSTKIREDSDHENEKYASHENDNENDINSANDDSHLHYENDNDYQWNSSYKTENDDEEETQSNMNTLSWSHSQHGATHSQLNSHFQKIDNDCGQLSTNYQQHRSNEFVCLYEDEGQVCGKIFLKKWLFENHYRTHTGEKPFICSKPNCAKAFADRSNLRAHAKTHEEKEIECPKCKRKFSLPSYLKKHRETACEKRLRSIEKKPRPTAAAQRVGLSSECGPSSSGGSSSLSDQTPSTSKGGYMRAYNSKICDNSAPVNLSNRQLLTSSTTSPHFAVSNSFTSRNSALLAPNTAVQNSVLPQHTNFVTTANYTAPAQSMQSLSWPQLYQWMMMILQNSTPPPLQPTSTTPQISVQQFTAALQTLFNNSPSRNGNT